MTKQWHSFFGFIRWVSRAEQNTVIVFPVMFVSSLTPKTITHWLRWLLWTADSWVAKCFLLVILSQRSWFTVLQKNLISVLSVTCKSWASLPLFMMSWSGGFMHNLHLCYIKVPKQNPGCLCCDHQVYFELNRQLHLTNLATVLAHINLRLVTLRRFYSNL